MRRFVLRVAIVLAVLLTSAQCGGFVKIPLSNAEMDTFTSGVSTFWSSFATGFAPASLGFFADSANYRTSPYAQGISGIDTVQPAGHDFGVGLTRSVTTTPGKVYLFVGFQDLYEPYFLPPPARRYAHFFGIGPHGNEAVPSPFEMGLIEWMADGQWFYNDLSGNSTQVGGMHRCMAACVSESFYISLWTGVHCFGAAPVSPNATHFDADAHALYEFDFPTLAQLTNPGFETVDNVTPELNATDVHRIRLPANWAPVGGGFGQNDSYYTEALAAHSGSTGMRVYNKRGTLTRGTMQRVAIPAGKYQATFAAWVRANKQAGAVARVGIDPTGGGDINSPSIVWSSYERTDEAWGQVSAWTPCNPGAITLFLAVTNTGNSLSYYGDFDDLTLDLGGDATPPEPFSVSAQSSATLLHFLSAEVVPAPQDPESGIAAVDYQIGTTPGGGEARPYTPCEEAGYVGAPGLSLTPGQTYYITVRATNGAGLARVVTSQPILCQPNSYAYDWSGPRHLSQTSYNADNPRLAVGQSGEVYAVWRESNDVSWDGSDSQVVLRKRSGGHWGAPSRLNQTANAWWPDVTATATGPSLSYLSPGDATRNTLRFVTPAGDGFSEQTAAADVSPFSRVVSLGGENCAVGCYRNPSAGASAYEPSIAIRQAEWTVQRLPGSGLADSAMRISVAAAGSTAHCLWGQFDQGEPALFHCSRNGFGQFSAPVLVSRGARRGDIAVESDGTVHVVYALSGGVWYSRSDDGLAFTRPEYLDAASRAFVDVEPSGRVHVLLLAITGGMNENGVATVEPVHLFRDPDGWSMPRSICPPSCTSGIWAEEPGDFAVDPFGELHLVWSNNPHDRGWQGADFEGYYWVDYYTTGEAGADPNSILEAKLWGDDAPCAELGYPASKTISLSEKEVTASGTFKFDCQPGGWKSVPCFYIVDEDRLPGIRVLAGNAQDTPTSPDVEPGELVIVSGALSTIGGERTIGFLAADGQAQGIAFAAQGYSSNPARPVFVSIAALGGSAFGPTPGVTGGSGLNNIGLLVRTVGKVVATGLDERGVKIIWIDDGSHVPCGQHTGCKVYAPGSAAEVGDFVTVTGISSTELHDPTPGAPGDESQIRVLMPVSGDAVEVLTR